MRKDKKNEGKEKYRERDKNRGFALCEEGGVAIVQLLK